MASISRQPNGRRTIQFMAPNGKRRSIRLGKVTQRMTETVKLRVELLVAAKLSGHAIDDETSRWLTGLDATLTDKLAAVGLVPRRELDPLTTMAGFLTEYVSRRVDVKPATKEVWSQVTRNLLECYGGQRDLRTIDETAAEDFKLFLLKVDVDWQRGRFRAHMKHYLMTTESDFSKAMGRLVEKAVQNPVQSSDNSGAVACRSDSREVARNDISRCETTAYAKSCDDLPRPAKYISGEDRTGTPLENTGNMGFFDQGAANSGAVSDAAVLAAELARIVAVWPMLPAPIRRAKLALLDCQE